jgi:hypothetical protein
MDAELFKPFKLANKILKTTGIWQDGHQSWKYFFLGNLNRFLIIEYCLIILSAAVDTKNLQNLIKDTLFVAAHFILVVKCWNFQIKFKNIQKLFSSLDNLIKFSADDRLIPRNHIIVEVQYGYKIYRVFWMLAWVNCVIGFLKAIFVHELAYNAWFPANTETSNIAFWSAAVFLEHCALHASAIDITLDMLPVIFMTFTIGLINELSARMEKIGEMQDEAKMKKELIQCIEIHKKIKKLVDEIRDNFSIAIFIQGFISSFIMCACSYGISKVIMIWNNFGEAPFL